MGDEWFLSEVLMVFNDKTSLNYNCDKVESKEGGLRRDGVENNIRFGFLRFCRCKKWCNMSRLDQGHQRYKGGLKMGLSAHCRVLLHKLISDLDS